MSKRTKRQTGQVAVRRAFTLVELMVVIVVIALLISILLPAVNTVKTQARIAASKAVMGTVETGLETFKADSALGGAYPPSWSDQPDKQHYGQVRNPYTHLRGTPVAGDWISVGGAGLLTWSLVGADQLGTPGFKVFRSTTNTDRLWSADTDDLPYPPASSPSPATSGAYAMSSNGDAVQTRHGPYVDTSKVRLSEWNGAKFEIKAETEANPTSTARRVYPMFLDAFGFPVLYWRADAAGTRAADQTRRRTDVNGRGIYHVEDNTDLVDADGTGSTEKLVLRPGASTHLLSWHAFGTNPANSSDVPAYGTFPRYVLDEAVQAKFAPQRADSYLLISPGPDGLYGTADDITNFKPNAR